MHAILSINHPNAPTGEICMGCGWTPKEAIDPHLIHSIEAVNGGAEEGQYSGISFWEKYLNRRLSHHRHRRQRQPQRTDSSLEERAPSAARRR